MRFTKTIAGIGLFIPLSCLAQQPYHNSLVWRANQWMQQQSAATNCSTIDAEVVSWGDRVVANGGAAVSSTTSNAVNCFYLGCVADGIWDDLWEVNCFVSDNLIAALTPLKVYSTGSWTGSNVWINHNFVAGDLTINGLQGDGSSKYLDMGMKLKSGANTYPIGISIYRFASTNNYIPGYDIGTSGTSLYGVSAAIYTDTTAYFGAYNIANVNRDYVFATNTSTLLGGTNFVGFLSGSRTNTSGIALYGGNSSSGFLTLTNSNSSVTDPTYNRNYLDQTTIVFALNDRLGVIGNYSKHTLSFVAIHDGLTPTKTQQLYNRVQSLRWMLGGGYQ